MRALVLADGTSSSRRALDGAWPGWDLDIELVIAADGGARLAAELDLAIDAWVGDGDSLTRTDRAALHKAGVIMLAAPIDKDESDAELAVREAVRRGATDITILGALGGARQDHALANVTLLAHRSLDGRGVRLLDASARVSLIVGERAPAMLVLEGRVGDIVTLLPLGASVEGVSVEGLAYPLSVERLEAGSTRGLSNVRTTPTSRIRIESGWLLVVETPATLTP